MNLTMAEFEAMLEGYNLRQEKEYEKLLFLAWHVEGFARQKKLPSLEKLLKPKKNNKRKFSQEECVKAAREKGLKGPWDKGGEDINGH